MFVICTDLLVYGLEIKDWRENKMTVGYGTVVAAGSIISINIVEPNCVMEMYSIQVLRYNVTWLK